MDAPLATVLGASIAAIAAIIGAYFSAKRQSKLEFDKWLRTKEDEKIKEIRTSIADLAKAISRTAIAMSWITWKCAYTPDKVLDDDIETYDKEMRDNLMEITNALVMTYALGDRSETLAIQLIGNIHKVDVKIAEYIHQDIAVRKSDNETAHALLQEANELYNSLPTKVAEILNTPSLRRRF